MENKEKRINLFNHLYAMNDENNTKKKIYARKPDMYRAMITTLNGETIPVSDPSIYKYLNSKNTMDSSPKIIKFMKEHKHSLQVTYAEKFIRIPLTDITKIKKILGNEDTVLLKAVSNSTATFGERMYCLIFYIIAGEVEEIEQSTVINIEVPASIPQLSLRDVIVANEFSITYGDYSRVAKRILLNIQNNPEYRDNAILNYNRGMMLYFDESSDETTRNETRKDGVRSLERAMNLGSALACYELAWFILYCDSDVSKIGTKVRFDKRSFFGNFKKSFNLLKLSMSNKSCEVYNSLNVMANVLGKIISLRGNQIKKNDLKNDPDESDAVNLIQDFLGIKERNSLLTDLQRTLYRIAAEHNQCNALHNYAIYLLENDLIGGKIKTEKEKRTCAREIVTLLEKASIQHCLAESCYRLGELLLGRYRENSLEKEGEKRSILDLFFPETQKTEREQRATELFALGSRITTDNGYNVKCQIKLKEMRDALTTSHT